MRLEANTSIAIEGVKTREQLLKEVLNPKHTALLVVDVQKGYCAPDGQFAKWGHDVAQIQSTVPLLQELIDQAHAAGVQVIATKMYEDVRSRTEPGKLRALLWNEKDGDGSVACEEGAPDSEIYQLKLDERDIIIEKHSWSSFSGMDKDGKSLDEILKAKGISNLVIGGMIAETCVDGTIREAYERQYHVIVPENSVGSNKPRQLEARMEYWRAGYVGNVVTEDFIKECWPPVSKDQAN